MPDVLTPEERRRCMSAIRSSGNRTTEVAMVEIFRKHGVTGWRRGQVVRIKKSQKTHRIRPDFLFRAEHVAVFVDGEFWHGHPTKCRIPQTRRDWWLAKIEGNKRRDRHQNRLLRRAGWRVIRVWRCEIGTPACIRKLRRADLI
jgi:DNA mismatch endonuclease (patch repair protein)